MKSSFFAILFSATLTVAAQASPNDGIVGAYARVEVGRSTFGVSSALPQTGADKHGQAVKVFGGYRFNENLGVEAGYAALGKFSESVTIGGTSGMQDGKVRSIFGAATGRLPLGESLALHGRLGVSSGKVSGTNVLPAGDNLMGSRTSALFGVGAEYRPKPYIALTVNYDSFGKLSNKVKASALVFGLHLTL
ncbi:MAG: porin family protein [Burkholderiales bacterium]